MATHSVAASLEPETIIWRNRPVAVLASGGVDSAVLTGELAQTSSRVIPIYIRTGMIWEDAEEFHLRKFLAALKSPNVTEPVCFDLGIDAIYGDHWSTTGQGTPDAVSADEAVYLPGRNLLLLSLPMLWCHLNGIGSIAIALLRGNPFPDSTPEFFGKLESVFATATGGRVAIRRPYAELSKRAVVERGLKMPLDLTFSCIHPVARSACGHCNKCEERRRGFLAAGLDHLAK